MFLKINLLLEDENLATEWVFLIRIFIPKQKYPFQLISAPTDIKSVHRHNTENVKMGSVQQERPKILPQPSPHNSLLPVGPKIVVGSGKRVCESPQKEA